jgi:hypothetical protein
MSPRFSADLFKKLKGSSRTKPHPAPIFIAGIKYPSVFDAGLDSSLTSISVWKGLKKSGGLPVMIRGALVVLESWVYTRTDTIEKEYLYES